eukprot:7384980-Prymnesium_polylepis.3
MCTQDAAVSLHGRGVGRRAADERVALGVDVAGEGLGKGSMGGRCGLRSWRGYSNGHHVMFMVRHVSYTHTDLSAQGYLVRRSRGGVAPR